VDRLEAAGFEVRSASRRNSWDLTDRAAIEKLVASLPRLDVLVNNAGRAQAAPLHGTDDAQWDLHLALNATAPFLLSRAALPLLRAAPRGRIINVASTAALRGSPYIAAYAASKHALIGLSRVLATELRDVEVNAVCPGYVDSPLTDRSVENIRTATGQSDEQARAALAAQNPCGRLITPAQVADAVFQLVQSEGTGREIVIE